MNESVDQLHKLSYALNHKIRKRIFNLIYDYDEICVTDIYKRLQINQSEASRFLTLLKGSGLVKCRRDGKFRYYSANVQLFHKFQQAAKIFED